MKITFNELNSQIIPEKLYKLPTAKALKESDTPVLISETYEDITITVYINGLILYTDGFHSTVSTMERCSTLKYYFAASADELANGGSMEGCTCHLQGEYLVSEVPYSVFSEMSWDAPIRMHCELILDRNRTEREEKRIAFHYGSCCDDDIWDSSAAECEALCMPDTLATLIEIEQSREECHKLGLALEKLTDTQFQVVNLIFYRDFSQVEAAKYLGISQPGVRKNLELAISKLKKEMAR